MDECPWPPAPLELSLLVDEIHLWCAPLDLQEAATEDLTPTLAVDERQRASRFRTGRLRNRFIAGRGSLRAILARYLHTDPVQLGFDYGPHGKPVLGSLWSSKGIHFNVSHSQELAVIAVAARPVGVDVEWIRPMKDAAHLIERFFSADEKRQWERLPAETQPTAFFHGWTCKEAWLKAVGSGLSFPLNQFCVSMNPGEPARVVSIRGDTTEAAQWQLESCRPAPGYLAALAASGVPLSIRHWRFAF